KNCRRCILIPSHRFSDPSEYFGILYANATCFVYCRAGFSRPVPPARGPDRSAPGLPVRTELTPIFYAERMLSRFKSNRGSTEDCYSSTPDPGAWGAWGKRKPGGD